MEIQFYGGNCVRLTTKKASVIVDDNLKELGAKQVTKADDIALYTGTHDPEEGEAKLLIDQPGEYEVSDTSIQGIAARAHMDEPGQHTATIYKIVGEDIRVAVVGHIYPELSDEQLEKLGMVDVLIIPVGGNGYTLDGIGALSLIKKIEPKLVIPTYYADKSLNFPVPAAELADALKNLAMEPQETLPKIKLKSGDLVEGTRLVVLEKQ